MSEDLGSLKEKHVALEHEIETLKAEFAESIRGRVEALASLKRKIRGKTAALARWDTPERRRERAKLEMEVRAFLRGREYLHSWNPCSSRSLVKPVMDQFGVKKQRAEELIELVIPRNPQS